MLEECLQEGKRHNQPLLGIQWWEWAVGTGTRMEGVGSRVVAISFFHSCYQISNSHLKWGRVYLGSWFRWYSPS